MKRKIIISFVSILCLFYSLQNNAFGANISYQIKLLKEGNNYSYLCLDNIGNILVSNYSNDVILKVNKNGETVDQISGPASQWNGGMVYKSNGDMFIGQYNSHIIYKGNWFTQNFSQFVSGYQYPEGMVLHGENIYLVVARFFDVPSHIYKIDNADNLSFVTEIPGSGTSTDLTFDSNGNMFVCDYYTDKVFKIDSMLNTTVYLENGLQTPYGLATDDLDTLVVLDREKNGGSIFIVPPLGFPVEIPRTGSGYSFSSPHDIVFAGDRFYFTAFQGLYELKFSLKGDTVRDGKIALDDVILSLQIASGVSPLAANCNLGADVNGDNKIGIEESIYDLQYLSGLRNHPPVFDSIAGFEADEGTPVEFKISAYDPDGDLLIYSASNLPEGATFDEGTRTFSWTPTYSQAGIYSATFTVADTFGASDSDTITITINDALPVFEAETYFPLSIGNWWEFKDDSTGEIHRSTISGTKSIDGTNTKIYSYPNGCKRYYTSDSNGLQLYGEYIISDSYTGDVIFNPPLLLAPNNASMGTIQVSNSSYSITIYIPDYGYTPINVDITSTTKLLDVNDVTTEHTTLVDCLKTSMQLTQHIHETGETIIGDTSYYWLYKGIGPVRDLWPGGSETIIESYVNGLNQTY